MNKIYKYGLLLVALGFLGYHSVYFRKLSEVKTEEDGTFDFQVYADSIYYQGMLVDDRAIELSNLLSALKSDADGAFERHGNRLGIGNSAYFLVKSSGTIAEVTGDAVYLSTQKAGRLAINTKYIFGNALRDASGLVKLTDFKTNAEFNRVSEALNSLIRKEVLPPVLNQLEPGDSIEVVGAIKLSKKNLADPALTITPTEMIPR